MEGIFKLWRGAILLQVFSFFYVCVFSSGVIVPMWRSKGSLITFHSVGPGAQTQIVRLGSKLLYLLSCPTDPREGSLVLELSREGGLADQ